MASRQIETTAGDDTLYVPLVLIDGRPRDDVWVKRVVIDGLLDERAVELGVKPIGNGADRQQRAVLARLRGARFTVLVEAGLEGGESRLWPIAEGRIEQVGQTLDGRRDQWTVSGRCDWSRLLDQPADGVDDAAALFARLGVSDGAAVSEQPVRGATLRSSMKAVCEQAGVCVQRRMQWAGQGVSERRRLRKLTTGRPIALSGGALNDATGAVSAMRGAMTQRGPMKLIAQMGPAEVESTFGLIAGWSAADEGLTDDQYVKSTSSDFDAVANVYRAWVLNEDGAYGQPAFDLTALFGDGQSMAGRTARCHSCLTRDDAGRSLGVVVEASIDSGVNWARYAGRLTVMSDRAGVSLDDDTLPNDFFTAAKAGQARVRVTATVRSAWPTKRVRWIGNPFAGHFEQVRFDLSDRYAWRRVDATSRYAEAVTSGQRTAQVADDRPAMENWLVDRSMQPIDRANGQVKLTTTRPMFSLRIGDRLAELAGWRIGATVDDPAIRAAAQADAHLMRIEHRWEQPVGSALTWQL